MSSTSSTTTDTPAPISPFSSLHSLSEATSDELPDLGAFRTVFRALSDLHPLPILTRRHNIPSTIMTSTTPTQSSSAFTHPRSTVWAHNNIASYLQSHTEETDSVIPRPRSSSSLPESHTTPGSDETERRIEIEEIDSFNEFDEDDVQVSLGYLNETLSFIAAERERLAALRGSALGPKLSSGANTSTSESEPGRKRRQKRNKSVMPRNDEDPEVSAIDADDSCSSSDPTKSSSVTPRVNKARLKRTRSTPSLRDMPPNLSSSSSTSVDPRISRLRSLASKLRVHFPSDAPSLRRVLYRDQPDEDDFVDPRGPPPDGPGAPLIHVFIDHSNMLIGLLTYIKRHPRLVPSPRRARQLSHAALSLILERGRPIDRRVLVTSSPLYQPMDDAARLGYEVRVYARVPRNDSTSDLVRRGSSESPKKPKSHTRTVSSSSNTESSEPKQVKRTLGQYSSTTTSSSSSSTPSRVRYREQGVDELLQLKIHDALAQSDGRPPPGSTIVLATGDGNAGQFSDDGFLGPVRVALRKGWSVELVAWEDGLSRSWKREFENEGAFRIIGMERFASDLVQVYC